MHEPSPPACTGRRSRRTLGLAALVLAPAVWVALLSSGGVAAGQEEGTTEESATTTTGAPPTTVLLDDGDFGIIPPGGSLPGAPPEDAPEEGRPGGEPGDGEVPLPEELAVVVLPDPTPGLNAALAAIDVSAAEGRVLATGLPVLAARERTAVARWGMAEALGARRQAQVDAVVAKARIDALAINTLIYGDPAGIEPLAAPETVEELRDHTLRDIVSEHVHASYVAGVDVLRYALGVEAAATRDLVAAQRAEHDVERAHLLARADLERAIVAAREARNQVGPAILGTSVLDTADLVAWYRTYYPADPPMAPIADIIDAYLAVGAEEGVTGDIAFAQAILETGGFRSGHAHGFNFAGIGAYDRCAPVCGFRFPNLRAGVAAHIHLLRAYADPGLTTAQLASQPNPQVAPERIRVRGCCQRWTALTGVWASDTQYDRKVLGIYRLMVETARALDGQQP
jgi:hypothetical protein